MTHPMKRNWITAFLWQKYENLFSAQKEGTDIWKINHSQGQAVEVSDETIDILNAGIAYSKSSNGKFDITVGKLSSLWDFSESSSRKSHP